MFDVIIAANGLSQRAGLDKLSFSLNGVSVLDKTVDCFSDIEGIDGIIVVTDRPYSREGVTVINGGATRAQSVINGVAACSAKYVLVHDGARPFVTKRLIEEVMAGAEEYGACIPVLPVTDTLHLTENGLLTQGFDRTKVVAAQTPQGFKTDLLKKALADDSSNTDEAAAYEKHIGKVHTVKGETTNTKLTFADDFALLNTHSGNGFDAHRFGGSNPLVLGGVVIPYEQGLIAHSDGDVIIHAIIDALLSAVCERDIGVLFPDNDQKYKDIDSKILLNEVMAIVRNKNARVTHLSVTVMAQAPKLNPYVPGMKRVLAPILGITPDDIGVTATTTEGLGIIGEKKGIAAVATVNVI